MGLNLNIPLRNRVAKADQYRSELEYRQAELRLEQLKKQVRIEVRNAQYALEQTGARVQAARKARDLAQRTFDITKKEQDLGSGSSYQTLSAQRDLALAELDLVTRRPSSKRPKLNWTAQRAPLWNIMAYSCKMRLPAVSDNICAANRNSYADFHQIRRTLALSALLNPSRQLEPPRILAADDQDMFWKLWSFSCVLKDTKSIKRVPRRWFAMPWPGFIRCAADRP